MAIAHNDVPGLWFGTLSHMEWLPSPLSGADVSPTGWNAETTLLSGGGFGLNSFGSHKRYQYSWSDASARLTAQTMKSFADGSYGRGLIYFQDPLTYDMNVLPAQWADTSMAVGNEGASLVYGVEPTGLPATPGTLKLPAMTTNYDLATVAVGFRGVEQAVFVPVPDGYELKIGAVYSSTGSGGIFVSPQTALGSGIGAAVKLTELPASTTAPLSETFSGVAGVWLWIGKTSAGAATVNIRGLMARLVKTGDPTVQRGPWVGGMGHSGAVFNGKPTYIEYSGVHGGQVGFAASFIETGTWLYG